MTEYQGKRRDIDRVISIEKTLINEDNDHPQIQLETHNLNKEYNERAENLDEQDNLKIANFSRKEIQLPILNPYEEQQKKDLNDSVSKYICIFLFIKYSFQYNYEKNDNEQFHGDQEKYILKAKIRNTNSLKLSKEIKILEDLDDYVYKKENKKQNNNVSFQYP